MFIVLVKNVICPAFCPSIYEPVCGSNKVTYPNLCTLRFAECEFENDEKITLKHQGPCGQGNKILYPYLPLETLMVLLRPKKNALFCIMWTRAFCLASQFFVISSLSSIFSLYCCS